MSDIDLSEYDSLLTSKDGGATDEATDAPQEEFDLDDDEIDADEDDAEDDDGEE